MSSADWETASEIEWEAYYSAIAGRSLRELFVDPTPFIPTNGARQPLSRRSRSRLWRRHGDARAAETRLDRAPVDHAPEGIARLRQSVSPVAGHFFGPHDTWSGTPDMTFHTRAEIEAFFAEFEIVRFREQDEDGEAVSGPKH